MVEIAQAAVGSVRERILEAAERVVCAVGAARMTLDGVAQAAGVSKGGLLYHFPSKEALLSAMAHRYAASMQECIDAAKRDEIRGDEVEARVVGILERQSRAKVIGLGAAMIAAAANDPALLEVIRAKIAAHTDHLAANYGNDFARATIVTLAIDGLILRESLRISTLTDAQREQIVKELRKLAREVRHADGEELAEVYLRGDKGRGGTDSQS